MICPRPALSLPAIALALSILPGQALGAYDGSPTPSQFVSRPVLAAPLPPPDEAPPTLDTDRPPDARKQTGVVLFELWVPQEPIQSGSWLPATFRITNLGKRPIHHAGTDLDHRCTDPALVDFKVSELFDSGLEWEGNAAIFKDEYLRTTPLGSMRMGVVASTAPDDCGARIEPGASVETSVATWPRYVFRDQPLPSGSADVTTSFSFWPKGGSPRNQRTITLSAPVTILGKEPNYPSPQRLVDVALADLVFGAWIESRDLSTDWNIDLQGIYAPEGYSFAGLHYAGGVAPDETMVLGVFASPDADGWARASIDPWTTTVEAVRID